ncbi:efflux RND transporter periplasmic adaptor subunit [Govanella unica]|uniref:HlyD family secretion protein n=1 Tax=Govanella unica TaxID=2975056 RepID=A0A9X3Z7V4_9PROT|nr:HlyD family secretion protein [Govania unica]MDA5194389.1 HlyD family secretion protein [Govania unica]
MPPLVKIAIRVAVTIAALWIAWIVGNRLWDYYMNEPWTRDGRIRADIVQVATDVSGLVIRVQVIDDQFVKKGDVLFEIDRIRYEAAKAQAVAALARARVDMLQQQRDAERFRKIGPGAVTAIQSEQTEAAADMARATYQQAQANLKLAEINIERTEVRSPVNGYVTNLTLKDGEYVTTGQAVMALVDSDSFRIDGYFEETKLPRIRVGDPATIRIMGVEQSLKGHVESIAAGIADRDRTKSPDLIANVNPTFNWVRLAQRIPVRIKIDDLPKGMRLIAGQTTTVIVGYEQKSKPADKKTTVPAAQQKP